jgi:hypothetical protein
MWLTNVNHIQLLKQLTVLTISNSLFWYHPSPPEVPSHPMDTRLLRRVWASLDLCRLRVAVKIHGKVIEAVRSW